MKKFLSWLKKYEYLFAVIFMLGGVAIAQWTILIAPNNLYPQTVDGMGHLAKIKYMADCIREGVWPSWFPYWYNGATTVQYYPPLAYIWALPAQLVTDNSMLAFKWLTASSMFVGSMGVWVICRKLVAPGVGLIAGSTYALQPFLNQSLLGVGMLAQAPVYAITPWLVYSTCSYLKSGKRRYLLLTAITTGALILSHAMHAYLIAICLGVLVLTAVLLGLIHAPKLVTWMTAILGGGGLAAFWWMPGVTRLETAKIPYMLPELSRIYSASIDWFNPIGGSSQGFYFSISILIFSLIALIPLPHSKSSDQTINKRVNSVAIITFTSFVFSVWFAFGQGWYLFKFVPMHDSLVPGRILSYSALLGSVLLAIVVYKLFILSREYWAPILILAILLVGTVFLDELTIKGTFATANYEQSQKDIKLMADNLALGKKDIRFSWVLDTESELSYFSYLNGFMITDGWNIEGTPHNQALWNHRIALSPGCEEYVTYITRNLLQWNVRSLIIANKYTDLQSNLESHGFTAIKRDIDKTVFSSSTSSAYVMQLKRNALVIGKSAAGVAMTYPWMIQGDYSSLDNYPLQLLKHFDLIYLVDPEVKDLNQFENQIKQLVDSDITIIIEPGSFHPPPYFGIVPYAQTNARKSSLVSKTGSSIQISSPMTGIPDDAPFISGLDEVLLETDETGEKGPVVGYKNVGQGKVYFVGLSLSEQLEATWIKSRGMETKAPNGDEVRAVLEKILDLGNPVKDIDPDAFASTSPINWRPDGFSFNYSSSVAEPAWVSVTYTPRWRVTVDGQEHPVYNLENLMLLDLPPGDHTVNFDYGMTWVGKLGIIITVITIMIIGLLLINPRWFTRLQGSLVQGFNNMIKELFYQ